jgi:ABC-type Fe3+/spermidine/putrescine transport system ATPase subunit
MAINNTILDIADEIFTELGSPSDISLSSISYWVRSHIGNLNNLIGTEIDISSETLEFVPEITEEQKSILKKLHDIYYSFKSIQSNLGASAYDIISYRSDGAEIRRVDKNNVAKTYLELRSQHQAELDQLVNSYKLGKAIPLQITGDDIFTPFPFVKQPGFSRRGDSNI